MERREYILWGGSTLEHESEVVVMRGVTRFTIRVRYTHIEKTRFGKEYLMQLKNSMNRGQSTSDTSKDPTALLLSQCLPLLKTLAPQTSIQGLTVEDLCHCPVYSLELVGTADTPDVQIKGAEHVSYAPSYDISPMPTIDLPESCQEVPRVQSSGILIAPTPGNADTRDIKTSQGMVSTVDGLARYFKPRLLGREAAFEREISILGLINEVGLRSYETRLSNLIGIVVLDGPGEKTVGMLMEWIPPSAIGSNLLSEGLWGQYNLHKKWHEQVTATVSNLHGHRIVWGDVNPGNIAIDDDLNAWIIDFGGLNNSEFVDDSNMETSDGDWQGVRRIFEEWLPNRQVE